MDGSDPASGVILVRAGTSSVRGEVRRAGDSYVNVINGSALGGPTGLDFSIYRLANNIRLQLPAVAPEGWQVLVECERRGKYCVAFADSDLRFESDESWRDEIWELIQHLPRHTLSDAIESAAALVKHCVRSGPELLPRDLSRAEES